MNRTMRGLIIFFVLIALKITFASHSAQAPVTPSTMVMSCVGTLTYENSQGATGTIYGDVVFTKTSSGVCQIKGWPTVVMQTSVGSEVPTSISHDFTRWVSGAANHPPTLIHMRQGDRAMFQMAYSAIPAGDETSCPSFSKFQVSIAAVNLGVATSAYPLTPCNQGQIVVSPIYPG
ncbi:MAG: DUF4232 domain-containing protein [Actinomycetota bacterium]